MSGWNLPPGVTDADIDRAAPDTDMDRCRCGHLGVDHGPHSPFEDCCFVDGCDCECFTFPDYSRAGGDR